MIEKESTTNDNEYTETAETETAGTVISINQTETAGTVISTNQTETAGTVTSVKTTTNMHENKSTTNFTGIQTSSPVDHFEDE